MEDFSWELQVDLLENFWKTLQDRVSDLLKQVPQEQGGMFQRKSLLKMLKASLLNSFYPITASSEFRSKHPQKEFFDRATSLASPLPSKLFTSSELFTQEISFWSSWEPAEKQAAEDSLFGDTLMNTAPICTFSMAAPTPAIAVNVSNQEAGSLDLDSQLEKQFDIDPASLTKPIGGTSGYIALKATDTAPYFCANLTEGDPSLSADFKIFHPSGKVRFQYRGPVAAVTMTALQKEKTVQLMRHQHRLERFNWARHQKRKAEEQ